MAKTHAWPTKLKFLETFSSFKALLRCPLSRLQIAIAGNNNKSSLGGGAIAGIVIGAVAFLTAVLAALLVYVRRRVAPYNVPSTLLNHIVKTKSHACLDKVLMNLIDNGQECISAAHGEWRVKFLQVCNRSVIFVYSVMISKKHDFFAGKSSNWHQRSFRIEGSIWLLSRYETSESIFSTPIGIGRSALPLQV